MSRTQSICDQARFVLPRYAKRASSAEQAAALELLAYFGSLIE
jgi:hypothetical protein